MTHHEHYGVVCTIEHCGPRKPLRHEALWGAEEEAALLAADDLGEFAKAWKRSVVACYERQRRLRREARNR